MVKYVIEIHISDDEIVVNVSRDGRFYDEVELHPSDGDAFVEYLTELAYRIMLKG